MIDPRLVLVMLAAAATFYIGSETVKGAKWVGRHVKAGIHKVVHPHEVKP